MSRGGGLGREEGEGGGGEAERAWGGADCRR